MGILDRIKGLFGRESGAAEPEPRQPKGEEERDIEAVHRSLEQDRATAYERLTDVDGRSD